MISARVFGNVVLVDRAEHKKAAGDVKDYISRAAAHDNWDVLKSQFIDVEAVEAMRQGKAARFMHLRVQAMHERALELVGTITVTG